MRLWFALFCFVLLPSLASSFVFDHTVYHAQDVFLDVSVENTISFSSSPSLLEMELFYFPQHHQGQELLAKHISPPAIQTNTSLLFSWDDPSAPLSIRVHSTVQSSFLRPEIRAPILFPYTTIPAELAMYLQSAEIIVITPEIEQTAARIIGNETDAVRVAFLLASWVKEHIAYELSSVTIEASQTSQWVLENRIGVCDELTSLFIAFLRSQGIPARFVSGIAYTNLDILDTPWGPHGWAEVWFPGIGWVPYDVTYGQFGWVDATHVVFRTSVDAQTRAASYSVTGRDTRLLPGPVERFVSLINRSQEITPDVVLKVTPALDRVGSGGFNRIDAHVVNTRPYYVSTELFLVPSTRMQVLSAQSVPVLLEPFQSVSVPWLVQVDSDLRRGHSYTFPLQVVSHAGVRANVSFSATSHAAVHERSSLWQDEQSVSAELIDCSAPRVARVGEPVHISCVGEDVCIGSVCASEKTVVFDAPGVYTLVAQSALARRVLTFSVSQEPKLDLSASVENVFRGEDAVLRIVVSAQNEVPVEDVELLLMHPLFEQSAHIGLVSDESTFVLTIPSSSLARQNTVTISAPYASPITVSFEVFPTSFQDRVFLLVHAAFAWLQERIF